MESSKLLLSFCNVFPRGLALGVYDCENEDFEWVNLDKVSDQLMGVTGMAFYDEHYWVAIQLKPGGMSTLAKLDKNFNLVKSFDLSLTMDVHSLIPVDNGLLVNDTKKNRVNKVTFVENQSKINEEIFWKYSEDEIDTFHVNSIAKKNKKIYVSMLGQKPEQGWRLAKSGKILDITNNTIILDQLEHPHSLFFIDDELFYFESRHGNVLKVSSQGKGETILKLSGYLRGITYDKNYLYIGSSAFRRKSKSTGKENPPDNLKPDDFHSWIYRINRNNLNYEKKDMTMYGAEIFDLLCITHPYTISKAEKPIIKRMWKYEDLILKLDLK